MKFVDDDFKASVASERPFSRLHFKVCEELIWSGRRLTGIDGVMAAGRGAIQPNDWHQEMLALRENTIEGSRPVVIDLRTRKEAALGRFEAAIVPPADSFEGVCQWLESSEARQLVEGRDVLLYCTGGIRCEKAAEWMRGGCQPPSTLLATLGPGTGAAMDPALGLARTQGVGAALSVRHLRGGIHRYLERFAPMGTTAAMAAEALPWRGKNFVFDRRGSVGGDGRADGHVTLPTFLPPLTPLPVVGESLAARVKALEVSHRVEKRRLDDIHDRIVHAAGEGAASGERCGGANRDGGRRNASGGARKKRGERDGKRMRREEQVFEELRLRSRPEDHCSASDGLRRPPATVWRELARRRLAAPSPTPPPACHSKVRTLSSSVGAKWAGRTLLDVCVGDFGLCWGRDPSLWRRRAAAGLLTVTRPSSSASRAQAPPEASLDQVLVAGDEVMLRGFCSSSSNFPQRFPLRTLGN